MYMDDHCQYNIRSSENFFGKNRAMYYVKFYTGIWTRA